MLLAIAVILPTVCLLWFMTQAVKNERLAIRQKLIDVYSGRAQEVFFKNPQFPTNDTNNFSASIIYDLNDQTIYPVGPSQRIIYSSDNVQKVWKLEFSDANYVEAIKEYGKISQISSIPDEVYQCKMGIIRCLVKQNKFNDAIKTCHELAYPGKHIINEYLPEQIARAGLMLADLYSRTNNKDLLKELQSRLSDSTDIVIPTEIKIFIFGESIKLAEKAGLADKLSSEIQNAKKVVNTASLSIMAADYLESHSSLKSWPQNAFRKMQTQLPLYGIYFKADDKQTVGLLTEERMTQFWQKSVGEFTDELVFCRIYDDTGQQIAGEQRFFAGKEITFGSVFSTLNLKNHFAGWKVELYLRAGVFREAADRKKFVYTWVAAIVIGLMLMSSLGAGKAVLKQAKLNRLKNDFIATVSHELKTPLASMRVLADTLLEGNYKDQQQATEYLELICKENKRLTGLIDNFLTFSRMERNKQAFDIVKTDPAEIAKSAAEAMQTKFKKGNCKFTVSVDKDLPSISADKDAMVTVLVNLLDNAYKYSYDDKKIELRVFAQEGEVCFSVKDNGIGMTRRAVKKIFNRFYQADSSLSRRAEGTGLGLSIVKFIVDAHKGQIEVESKPGKGSELKIIIPICKG